MRWGQRSNLRLWIGIWALVCSANCLSLQHRFLLSHYKAFEPQAIKRIEIRTWSPEHQPWAGQAVALMAADMLRLRSNYLIQDVGAIQRHWAETCTAQGPEGILLLTVHQAEPLDHRAHIQLSAALYRCQDGALIWRTQAETTESSQQTSMAAIQTTYLQPSHPAAAPLILPMYHVLRPLLEDIPDPVLSDEDIVERIELEGTPFPSMLEHQPSPPDSP